MQLLRADLQVWRQTVMTTVIDLWYWSGIQAGIMGYIMPALGLAPGYGVFIVAGLVIGAGFFSVFRMVAHLMRDIDRKHEIFYHMTLPIPSWLVLIKKAAFIAFNSAFLVVCVLPMGKVLLWYQFDLTKVSVMATLAMIVSSSIFYAFYILWLAGIVKNSSKMGIVWTRFNFPLWFLGCFQFSWQVLHKVCPVLAYINLANPVTYLMEGIRAALLGQDGFLNVWLCVLALLVFSLLCGLDGMRRLKRKLDYV